MGWHADLSNEAYVAFGDHVRAIGWLSSDHPFPQGEVSAAFVAWLREFVRLANESAEALYFPAFGGFHTCELCDNAHDSRNFGVPSGAVLFVAPGMIAHYVEQHRYAPPAEFIEAVMASPLPDTTEYGVLVENFRQIHKQWWEEALRRWQAKPM